MKSFLGVKELRDNPSVKPAACQLSTRHALRVPFQGSLIIKDFRVYFCFLCSGRFFFFFRTESPKFPSFLPRAKYSPWAYAIRPHCWRFSLPLLSRYCSSTLTPVISASNTVWVPSSLVAVTRHSRLTGHSAIRGALTVCAGSGVSWHWAN